MKLSDRLRTVASCVHKGDSVADIGTDHAYIPVFLVEQGISDQIIASDINQGPVDNAIKTIERYGMSGQIQAVMAPGLEGVLEPVDAIIIAGMGGLLIAQILTDCIDLTRRAQRLILQPMTASADLRRYLHENEFTIVEEKIAVEGEKFYEIIVAKSGVDNAVMTDFDYEVPALLRHSSDSKVQAFIERKIRVTGQIIEQMESRGRKKDDPALDKFKKRLDRLREVL